MPVLNVSAILAAVEDAEVDALNEIADLVVRDAKARAPVRKVFREPAGFRRKFRPLTTPEKALAIRRAAAYQGYSDFQRRRSIAYITHYARAEVPRRGSNNALTRSRQLRLLGTLSRRGQFTPRTDARRVVTRASVSSRAGRIGFASETLHPLLTARGRYELRSGRAIHYEQLPGGTVRVHLGGKLKASIHKTPPIQDGHGITIEIVAGVRYAKFVEFPTTHNAAQPFLLPALQDQRGRLKRALAQAIAANLKGE